MTDLALAPAGAAAPAAGATSAAALAARIEVPRRLPPRSTTESRSGTCRNQLLHAVRRLPGGLAAADTCTARGSRRRGRCSSAPASTTRSPSTTGRILEHRERLDLRAGHRRLPRPTGAPSSRPRSEQARRRLERRPRSTTAFELGAAGARADLRAARPEARRAGRRATPARVHARPGPDRSGRSSATSTSRPAPGARAGEPLDRVVDYKVKGQPDRPADRRPRPAGKPVPRRPLARGPARRRVRVRPDREARPRSARQMGAALITTRRTYGQLRAALARIALAASEIDAYYRALRAGPAVGVRRPDQLEVLRALLLSLELTAPAAPACDGGLPHGARYLPHEPTSTGSHNAQHRSPTATAPPCARRAAARSRPACSDGWPTTNAPTAAYPATAPQSAAAGRRRTHPSSPLSPAGTDRRKPHGRPPDQEMGSEAVCTAARSATAPPGSRASGSCARRHWQLVPAKLKRALRQAWRSGQGAGTRAHRAAAHACIRAARSSCQPACDQNLRGMVRRFLAGYRHPNHIRRRELGRGRHHPRSSK